MKTRDVAIVCGTALVVAYLVASPFRWKLGERRWDNGVNVYSYVDTWTGRAGQIVERERELAPKEAAARQRYLQEQSGFAGREAARLKVLAEHDKAGTKPKPGEMELLDLQWRANQEEAIRSLNGGTPKEATPAAGQ